MADNIKYGNSRPVTAKYSRLIEIPAVGHPAQGPLALTFCFLLILAFLLFYLNKMQNPQINSDLLFWNNIKERLPMDDQEQKFPDRNRTFIIRFKNIRKEFRMNFTDPCSNSTKVLILSLTKRDGFESRNGIRQTWMADVKPKKIIRFLLAEANEKEKNATISKLLEEEQAKHGDLVFIHGFPDLYQNLNLKTHAGWQWQQAYCPNVEWVLKADDDTIVDLHRFDYYADHKFRQIVTEHPLIFLGYIMYNDKPDRRKNSKWYVPESEFSGNKYPEYVHGPVYLTNPATISAILAQTPKCNITRMEDVLNTGVLGNMVNASRVDLRQHFTWHIMNYAQCENGHPSGISMWGVNKMKDFVELYKKIENVKCPKNN